MIFSRCPSRKTRQTKRTAAQMPRMGAPWSSDIAGVAVYGGVLRMANLTREKSA